MPSKTPWWKVIISPREAGEPAVAEMVAPKRPYDNYRKLTCPKCQIPYVLVIRDSKKKLPDATYCTVCRNILHPNEQHRRGKARYVIAPEVQYSLDGGAYRDARAGDFSPTGLRLIVNERIEPFQKVSIRSRAFEAKGQPVWMRRVSRMPSVRFEVGIRFDFFEPKEENLVLNIEA